MSQGLGSNTTLFSLYPVEEFSAVSMQHNVSTSALFPVWYSMISCTTRRISYSQTEDPESWSADPDPSCQQPSCVFILAATTYTYLLAHIWYIRSIYIGRYSQTHHHFSTRYRVRSTTSFIVFHEVRQQFFALCVRCIPLSAYCPRRTYSEYMIKCVRTSPGRNLSEVLKVESWKQRRTTGYSLWCCYDRPQYPHVLKSHNLDLPTTNHVIKACVISFITWW